MIVVPLTWFVSFLYAFIHVDIFFVSVKFEKNLHILKL